VVREFLSAWSACVDAGDFALWLGMSKWQSVSAIELVDNERVRTIWRFQAEYWLSTRRTHGRFKNTHNSLVKEREHPRNLCSPHRSNCSRSRSQEQSGTQLTLCDNVLTCPPCNITSK